MDISPPLVVEPQVHRNSTYLHLRNYGELLHHHHLRCCLKSLSSGVIIRISSNILPTKSLSLSDKNKFIRIITRAQTPSSKGTFTSLPHSLSRCQIPCPLTFWDKTFLVLVLTRPTNPSTQAQDPFFLRLQALAGETQTEVRNLHEQERQS